jgi:regulator of RNase E activity RraA
LSSAVSAPPQKVLPLAVNAAARNDSSPASERSAAPSSDSIAEFRAFAFSGRLRKIRASGPARSTSTMLSSYSREALKKVSTATLTTVLFKRGLRNVFIQGIFLLNRDAPRMVGEAFTLRYIPAREDVDQLGAFEGRGHAQREAIEACPPGHVLVMDARRDASAATGGDILMTRLMVRGVSGVVTDGGLRDSPTIEKLDWPAYCGARSAPLNLVRHHAVESQVPIGCGGVAVYPGDVLVGDAEGVVVIPAKMAEEVAKEAQAQTEFEDWVEAKVKEGRSIFGLYPPNAETKAEFEAYKKRR